MKRTKSLIGDPKNWSIRPVDQADIPALIAMQREGWTIDYQGYIPEGYGEIALKRYGTVAAIEKNIQKDKYYFVVEYKGALLGAISGTHLNETEAEIWWIHVPISERGQGVGRVLIDYFKAQLPSSMKAIYVTTFEGYKPTISFYQRVGFTPFKYLVQDYDGVSINDVRLKMVIQ